MKEYIDSSRPVSLYLHIPFCTTKCGYCAFYSKPECKCREGEMADFYALISAQLDALVEELKTPFYTIFIGGGNPGLLGPQRLAALIDTAQRYGKAQECTMEINPETLDESFESLLGRVTRISVGVQSFDTAVLKTLTRNARKEDCIRALELLSRWQKERGLVFNADLMTNIPRQSLASSLEDIETLASYCPDHISLYSLTFEEGTKLVESEVPLDEDEQADNLIALWERLEKHGYEHYEVSAFARSGHYCLHNLVYWSLGQYIGLGPSAESSLGWREIVSSREKETIEDYLANPSFDSLMLSVDETVEEYLLTSLRTMWGIDKKAFTERFGLSFDKAFGESIEALRPEYYINDEQVFRLTRDGVLVLDSIILQLVLGFEC